MKNEEIVQILLQGEKTKEELIYNTVINNLNLSTVDQVNYLKGKVCTLESEMKTRMMYTLIFLFAFITLCFGMILLAFDLYILGALLIFCTFAFVIIKLIIHFRKTIKAIKNDDFEKVDALKNLLESKLK